MSDLDKLEESEKLKKRAGELFKVKFYRKKNPHLSNILFILS